MDRISVGCRQAPANGNVKHAGFSKPRVLGSTPESVTTANKAVLFVPVVDKFIAGHKTHQRKRLAYTAASFPTR
jgi:hypothetical protein